MLRHDHAIDESRLDRRQDTADVHHIDSGREI